MKYDFHNHIRVFCNRFDLDRGSSEVKNLRNSFEQKEKFDKQTYEWLVGFLKCTSQKEAKSYVQQQLQELKEKKDLNPEERKKYEQQLKILSMWVMDKKLFPTSFFGKQNINTDSIKELQRGLGLSDSRIQELMEGEKQKRAEEWKNQPGNDIASYSKKILTDTLAHPMAVQRGKYLKVGEKLDFLSEISLYEEKRKIEKLGVKYLPEYHAVIMTLIAVTTDPKAKEEFDRYTGGFLDDKVQEWKGTRYNREDYRHGLEKILANAIASKIEQKPTKSLLETEQQENGRVAFEQLKKEVNIRTIMNAFKNGKNREEVKKELAILSGKIGAAVATHRGNLVQDGYRQMEVMLNTAYLAAEDDILDNDGGVWSSLKESFSGRKKNDYMSKLEGALQRAEQENKVLPVSWSKDGGTDGKGGFKVFSIDDILSSGDQINIGAWSKIMSVGFWQTLLIQDKKNDANLWSIAVYIENNPETNLLKMIPDETRRKEIKEYFLRKLTEHEVYDFETQKKTKDNLQKTEQGKEGINLESSYASRLYGKIRTIPELKVISDNDLKEIIKDGKIAGQELYKKLNALGVPIKYIELEKNLQAELIKVTGELEQEIEKTINEVPPELQTVLGVLKHLGTKESIRIESSKKIGDLSSDEAKIIYEILTKQEQLDPEMKKIKDILEKRSDIGKNQENRVAAGVREEYMKRKGPAGVKGISEGDSSSIEEAARKAGGATYDKARQIHAIQNDSEALDALKKIGYKPEDLNNQAKINEIQKKVDTMSDGPEKRALLRYIPAIQSLAQKEIQAFDTIIRHEGREAAVGYISSITGKTETLQTIDAYQYINKHIYNSVEYNQSAFTGSIARMNIGDSKSISNLVDGGEILGNSYHIEQTDRGVYTIKSASGDIVGKGLSEDQSEEVIEDMLLFASMGFGDLIPRLTDIKKQVALKTSRDTKLNGKTSEQEQLWIMRPLYEKLFGVQSETLNIHDFDRELRTIGQTPEERKKSVRQKLKENNLMRQDNTLSSPDTIISFLKTL